MQIVNCQKIYYIEKNYANNKCIMKNETIKNSWAFFILKYKIHFLLHEDIWKFKFEEVKKFIDDNSFKPSHHSKDIKIKTLGTWISEQQRKYNKNNEIMKNETIKTEWENFKMSDKYKKYFEQLNFIYNKI